MSDNRLTRKTASGKIAINEEAFPEYAPKTIWQETAYFEPTVAVVEKLYKFEEAESERRLAENV